MAVGSLASAWDRAGVEPCWPNPGPDVFVLGAGFSIAASSALAEDHRFPDTAQLGKRALARLGPASAREAGEAGMPDDHLDGRSFEGWLARLAEDQPYLSTAENFRRRALYLELAKSMRAVLVECEERSASRPPPWLLDLISVWHARRARIVTFNYDTLIERCLGQLALGDPPSDDSISVGDVLDGIPPAAERDQLLTGSGAATFRLVKLHGSTSWFWAPGDPAGTTVVRLDARSGAEEDDSEVQAERSRLLRGRDPFIVPPVSAKTALYANPVTRELWTRAHKLLLAANRVVVVGYSFPPVDVTATGLVVETLAGRSNEVQVDVVNLNADTVAGDLKTAGVTVSTSYTGRNAVERFVDDYVDDAARHVVTHLRNWQPEQRQGVVRVAWGPPFRPWHPANIATEIVAGRTLMVTLTMDGSTALDSFLDDLRQVDRIVVAGALRHPVVDWIPTAQQRMLGDEPTVDTWFVTLMPAGPPPSGVFDTHLGFLQPPGSFGWK